MQYSYHVMTKPNIFPSQGNNLLDTVWAENKEAAIVEVSAKHCIPAERLYAAQAIVRVGTLTVSTFRDHENYGIDIQMNNATFHLTSQQLQSLCQNITHAPYKKENHYATPSE